MNNADLPAIPNSTSLEEIGCVIKSQQITLADFAKFRSGITKRELFAAIAMNGILASDTDQEFSIELAAEISVRQADALLLELSKAKEDI